MREGRPQHGRAGAGRRTPAGVVCLLATIAALLVSCHDVMWAQSRRSTEYELKAAYLYNFGKFVRWPASVTPGSSQVFSICVLGKNPFGASLENTVKGESIEGGRLSVRYLDSVAEVSGCRILFVSDSEAHRLEALLAELRNRPILTVSDVPDFVDRGGDIEFVPVGDKIRFKVNLAAAEKRGLVLSSDLLKVAVSVKRNGQSGD